MLKEFGSENMRQFHSFFNLFQNMITIILCWFVCFVQITNMKLFMFLFAELAFHVCNLYNTHKSTKNSLSTFGSDSKSIEMFRIHLAVQITMVLQNLFQPTVIKLSDAWRNSSRMSSQSWQMMLWSYLTTYLNIKLLRRSLVRG